MRRSLAVILVTFALNAFSNPEKPVTQVETGPIQGTTEYNMNVFKNIPYAAPPVGDLRWRPPQPAASWSGTRDASQFGDTCPQPNLKNENKGLGLPGNEDCLKLNVFTPQNPGKDLPVMVWIHGGALQMDGARDPLYTPLNLVKNGVIVVTFDYRLGSLGFFASKELVAEAKSKGEPVGNYGTMDQIAVLKWVKRNIAAFGGDPNNVTIFGESAGARSVTWLMVSDAAKGLFHRAIAESAQQSPIRGVTEKRLGLAPATDIASKYMATLGVKSLKELRNLSVQKLVLTAAEQKAGEFSGSMIDGQILKGDPVPLFASGQQAKVPFMIGTNSWDASLFTFNQPPLDALAKVFKEDPKIVNQLYSNIPEKCAVSADLIGDILFRASTKFLADSMNGIAPGYAYYFDYLTKNIRPAYPGVPHAFEISFVFGSNAFTNQTPKVPESSANRCARIDAAIAESKKGGIWPGYMYPITDKNDPQDIAISEKMSASWAQFAKTGNPNVEGQANWPIYSLKNDVMRSFSPNAEIITGMLKDRVDYQLLHLKGLYTDK
ncbi:carboxylesterase/lipase family protein [Polynucleobacter sp.]|uniref:carboxylesterase/lipase family protein n=1 Tax=Polynucleobacter sp. TaxID=2029855 RepID=UPI003F69CBC2